MPLAPYNPRRSPAFDQKSPSWLFALPDPQKAWPRKHLSLPNVCHCRYLRIVKEHMNRPDRITIAILSCWVKITLEILSRIRYPLAHVYLRSSIKHPHRGSLALPNPQKAWAHKYLFPLNVCRCRCLQIVKELMNPPDRITIAILPTESTSP